MRVAPSDGVDRGRIQETHATGKIACGKRAACPPSADDPVRGEGSIQLQLADMAARPDLIRSFFKHPSVAYITDC